MAKPVWTDSQIINQLDSGSHWSGSSLTYGFPTSASWFPYSEKNTFSALNASQQTAATLAIKLWDDLMAPDFSLAANGATATIKYSNTTTDIGYAHAYFPGGWSGAGSVWFNANYGAGSGTNNLITPTVGNWGFQTYVHETGHALGLDHPGTYNGGSPTYTNDALYAQDSQQYTVMSYFTADNTGADWYASDGRWYYPQTPMLHDVMAIQSMYGAETTTRTSNTTYGFNATADVWLYDFTQNRHPVLCIYDSAGTDTIDLSGWSYACSLNLTPGTYSNCDMMTYNISIAASAWIENGVGGGGADTITGNNLANVLTGLAGNDTINGGLGGDTIYGGDNNDTLTGGAGNDIIDGGAGTDSAYFSGVSTSYSASWDAGTSSYILVDLRGGSPDGTDRVSSVENFVFSNMTILAANLIATLNPGIFGTAAAESLGGTAQDDMIYGLAGADTLNGLAGNDLLDGGTGNDTMVGGIGNDTYVVDSSSDVVTELVNEGSDTVKTNLSYYSIKLVANVEIVTYTGSANFTSIGNELNNRFFGGAGSDYLIGLGGNDVFIGGSGLYNTYQGGVGDDLYCVEAGDTVVEFAGEGNDQVQTWFTSHVLAANIETLIYTGATNFTGIGNAENNRIVGGIGNDTLVGYEGNDTLVGKGGINTLQGGTGNDVYVVDSTSDTLVEFAGEGVDEVQTGVSYYALRNYVENLTFTNGSAHQGIGTSAANVMKGASGNDTFTGAGGSDTFVFSGTVGSDRITDFNAAAGAEHDVIDLTGQGLNFAALTITQVSGGTSIGLGAAGSIFLDNVNAALIDQSDFFF